MLDCSRTIALERGAVRSMWDESERRLPSKKCWGRGPAGEPWPHHELHNSDNSRSERARTLEDLGKNRRGASDLASDQ